MNEYILEMKNVSKRFGGIKALSQVHFNMKKGEVHALLGENGAGKSTLMKILGGAYQKDEGEIYVNGVLTDISSPAKSQKNGIAVIYQEQALVDCLSIADNILLGRIPNSKGVINSKELLTKAQGYLEEVGITFDPKTKLSDLSVAQKQFVEIAKALSVNANVIVMDEPTSVLTVTETEKLFQLIRKLQAEGKSIIYISHRLEELNEIADRCTILKDGTYVDTISMEGVTKDRLISLMTGRTISKIYPDKSQKVGKTVLEVKNLSRKGVFKDVSFSVREGEILGMSGLVGSGRSEVCRSIFGVDPFDGGEILLNGKSVKFHLAKEAIKAGIIYTTEDRKGDGLILGMSIRDNISISTLEKFCKNGVIRKGEEKASTNKYIQELEVKCADADQAVGELSGGNQQKVMIARAMLANAKVIIIDEPTRGVDVGTKTEIYKIVRGFAEQGCAVIVISSELPEVIGLSDRILVMHEGIVTGEVQGDEASEQRILTYATGGEK